MTFRMRSVVNLMLGVLASVPFIAAGQTLSISNGIQTYLALTNTTVTMTARCELRITASNSPIPGCLINLNSPDAWFILQNIRPSAVSAGYLGQVRVNGAVAIAGSNCRVDEYGLGTVIIPHAPSFTPLQVFSGPNFIGVSAQLGIYTYYTNSILGGLNRNIGSFKLKRGYSATFAQYPNGTGISQVFVAQDADLEVGVMATNLDHACSFVRVFPWRWTGKRGWAGAVQTLVNPLWSYDWDNATTSTLDAEYVPMRHNLNWNAYANINGKQKSTHALGFNEPDRPDQANMSVATAIAAWPNLVQSGLRLGAPAVSDSGVAGEGLSWLYDFMAQADALNYRVDFVPVHFYKCNWTASQLYNYLLGVYQVTGRPVWVTEFNNGANWCGGTPPTLAQNAQRIGEFLDVMESAPFVERYAIYNWVGTNRAMVADDGTLTPAGIVYRDHASAIAYVQALPPGGVRSVAQLQFDSNTLDSSGYGNNGFALGIPGYTNGHTGQALALDGTNDFVRLPPNVANSTDFSFAAWVNWNGGGNWQRIFDFGDDTTHYLFLTPSSGAGTLRFGTRNGGSEQMVETTGMPSGQWIHVALTLTGNTARLYTNGVLAASSSVTIVPSSFKPALNYLGKSQFAADPLFSGSLDEVQIADYAFSAAQISALLTNQPPQFTTNLLPRGSASEGVPYTNDIIGTATDPDPGDTITYSKAGGPAWLNVSPSGVLTGTPTAADGGTNHFTVRATDSAGASAFAVVTISTTTFNASGVWSTDANGNWSDTNKWSGGIVGSGPGLTADFSAINISANRTVTLDTSRSIGTLKFGDTSGSQSWTISPSGGSTLTLDTGSIAQPSVVVTNTVTFTVPLAGTNGFVKSGLGMVVLGANNSLSGAVNLDRGIDGNNNDGITRIAHPTAVANVSSLNIRNTSVSTAGGATLQLDGTAGDIVIAQPVSVTCRNNSTTATIQNLSGTNTFTGFVGLNVGGNMFNIQTDAGQLVFTGTNQYVGALMGARSYAFSGAGSHLVVGPILNSTNGAPIGLIKSGAGTLTLAANNTYTNTTSVNGGTLWVNGSIGPGAVTVAATATLGGSGTIKAPVTVQSGGTLAPGGSIGKLTVSNSVTLQAGSTTLIEISGAPLTNDELRVTGLLMYGGNLFVTNIAGDLAPGNAFTLIQAPSHTSAFASVSLPPLNVGLAWDTSGLANGLISVIATSPPVIVSYALQGTGEFQVSGNGSASQSYQLFATTVLAPPVSWTLVTATVSDTNGGFQFSDLESTNYPQRFYRVVAP
jgi:autotransporter-associated beta strand protein